MSDIDEDALIALMDMDAPVLRAMATACFDAGEMVTLPSGRTITARHAQEWVKYVARKRLPGRATHVPARSADVDAYQEYQRAVDRYVAGTGTLDELTDAVTPQVAERISVNEHETAKRRESDRAAAAQAAACAARNKHRHVKRAVALVGAHKLMSFMIALITALIVVPWSLCGIDSGATGWGFLIAYVLAVVTAGTWTARAVH